MAETWCRACRGELPVLMAVSRAKDKSRRETTYLRCQQCGHIQISDDVAQSVPAQTDFPAQRSSPRRRSQRGRGGIRYG